MKRHKAIRFFMVITVFIMQVIFLMMTLKENYESNNFLIVTSVLLIALTIFFGYRYLDLHHEEHSYEKVSVVIWVPIGALICYSLNVYGDLGSVLAAGITGTTASFIPAINKKSDYLEKLPAAIYCGAFVGMSSVEISPSVGFIVTAGVLTGVFFMLSKNLFLGIGGKLGSIAFLGVVVIYLLNWLSI